MTLEEAKIEIAKENPDAIFEEVVPGYYVISDFTYSDELRAIIAEFDDCFGDIMYPDYHPAII